MTRVKIRAITHKTALTVKEDAEEEELAGELLNKIKSGSSTKKC